MKFLLDYLPLISFGVVYAVEDLLIATVALIVATIMVIPISWKQTGKMPAMHIFTAVLVGIMGGITVLSGDTDFIKMKPTIASLVFAGILLAGNFCKKTPLQILFSKMIEMDKKHWKTLSFRTAVYFIIMAVINEYVWRTQSEVFWVNFKIFGFTLGYFAFFLSQWWFLQKNSTIGK